jgi:hypothetical protein
MGEVTPTPDNCDGVDRMCNSQPLAGCACTLGDTRPCYDGSPQSRGVGACHDGVETCIASGNGAAWSGTCAGEQLPAPAENCSTPADDNCNGMTNENCGPSIQCPANITTPAGTPVNLTASASSPGGTITGYSWTITNAPVGGVGTPNQWNASPPTAATEAFLPYIVGVYTIHVTATDNTGAPVSCDVTVTAQGHGLRVQLTWDGAGDVDLHVHDSNTGSPWFRATSDDTFYANRTPIWDAASPPSQGGNPAQDFDNTTANGPENTRIDVAAIGTPYTIGVHYYDDWGHGPRIATIDIFCGGVTSPTTTFHSRAMQGPSHGPDCTNNDFWKVATVVFTSPDTCTITPIDSYSTAAARCSAF